MFGILVGIVFASPIWAMSYAVHSPFYSIALAVLGAMTAVAVADAL